MIGNSSLNTKSTTEPKYIRSLKVNRNVPFDVKRIYYLYDIRRRRSWRPCAQKTQTINRCSKWLVQVLLDDDTIKKL